MVYYINQNGENFGPYTIGQLRSMWHAGQVTGDTLYCEEGYAEWLRLSTLTEVLDTSEQPPLLPSKAGFRRPVLIVGVLSAVLVVILIFAAGRLSPSGKPSASAQPPPSSKVSVHAPVATQPVTSRVPTASETVTDEYARRINAFASKWDMTVEEVMRWDYVLSRRSLTLGDFDQAIAKLDQSREKAIGYRPNIPKRNTNGRRLVVGETKFPQNPVLTEDEENLVKVLKIAGY